MESADWLHYKNAIDRVLHYIECNLNKNFTLSDLADTANMSYHHFSHVFSDYKRQPIWNYVKEYRLKYAAGLLRHSNYSVADIADLTGYGGIHSFSKAFSNAYSISPKRFGKLKEVTAHHSFMFVSNEKGAVAEMETFCTVHQPQKEYYYLRSNPSEVEGATAQLVQWAMESRINFDEVKIAATSPDIYFVTQPYQLRIDVGFWATPGTLPQNITSRLLKKPVEAGTYISKTVNIPAPLVGIYLFEVIEMNSRYSLSSLRHHQSMVCFDFCHPQPLIKVFIPA
jgi:AraC-like DNA-binding protein